MTLLSRGPIVSEGRVGMASLGHWGLKLVAVIAAAVGTMGCAGGGEGQTGTEQATDYFSHCGNKRVDSGEQCDDGNRVSGDGCDANCQWTCSPADGNPNSACDDGNPCNGSELCNSSHQCESNLSAAPANGTACGDFSVCQDGLCVERSLNCGDGIVEPPEECDSGDPAGSSTCDATCHFPCIKNDPDRQCPPIECKDPTQTLCNADHSCTYVAGPNYALCNGGKWICLSGVCSPCGDGIVEPGEECDLGSGNGLNTGCEKNCKFSCVPADPSRDCSYSDKPCFVSNSSTCDTTTHACTQPQFQPNGTSCGSATELKDCVSGSCIPVACGDGIPGPGEICDDGNLNNRDGCKSDCTLTCKVGSDCSNTTKGPALLTQPNCNIDVCNTNTHTCYYQANQIGQPCSSSNGTGACVKVSGTSFGACTTATCGNGTQDPGEECDLGSGNGPNTGCEQTCQFSCHTDADCDDTDPCNGTETCVAAPGGGKLCNSPPPSQWLADGASCGNDRICLMYLTGGCAKPYCGDGFVDQSTEQCDPPNTLGCDSNCQKLIQCEVGDQWWAHLTEMPASWGQTSTWEAAFTGYIRQLMLIHAVQRPNANPPTFDLSLRVCGMQIPDFTLPDQVATTLGHMEIYGVEFPNSLWDNWTKDPTYTFSTTLTAYSLAPGGFVYIAQTSLPTGEWSLTGVSGTDWPSDFHALLDGTYNPWEQVDMDQDSKPAITAVVKRGTIPADSPVYFAQDPNNSALLASIKSVTTYSDPIADVSTVNPNDPSTFTSVGRSSEYYVAIRALTNATAPYSAKFDSCDQMSGTMTVRSTDNHVLGCWLASGANSPGNCTDSDASVADNFTPHYSMGNAAFTAKHIKNPPTSLTAPDACDTARRLFPTKFPPTVP